MPKLILSWVLKMNFTAETTEQIATLELPFCSYPVGTGRNEYEPKSSHSKLVVLT